MRYGEGRQKPRQGYHSREGICQPCIFKAPLLRVFHEHGKQALKKARQEYPTNRQPDFGSHCVTLAVVPLPLATNRSLMIRLFLIRHRLLMTCVSPRTRGGSCSWGQKVWQSTGVEYGGRWISYDVKGSLTGNAPRIPSYSSYSSISSSVPPSNCELADRIVQPNGNSHSSGHIHLGADFQIPGREKKSSRRSG